MHHKRLSVGCSRTGRRFFWALLSALLSWWLVYALRSIDVQGTEGLFFIFSAVSAPPLPWSRDSEHMLTRGGVGLPARGRTAA
jgi:hypothetical protein